MKKRLEIEKFLEQIDFCHDSGCWEWTGSLNGKGYGYFIKHRAHRYSYQVLVGPIPDKMSVCHHCDNRKCVKPSHLFLGTRADNNRDMTEKGRVCQGEDHPRAKLSFRKVRDIRTAYAQGGITMLKLANLYGVGETTINRTLSGESWVRKAYPARRDGEQGGGDGC